MNRDYSDSARANIAEILKRYPNKESALLPLLKLTQREFGALGEEEEKRVAALLDISPIRVREVVTFYTMLNRTPVGKYHIQVCSNLSCSLMGAESLIAHLSKKLGIHVGETTPDKIFTLSTVECLGACEQAPCMMINDDYFGHLDPKKIDEILSRLS